MRSTVVEEGTGRGGQHEPRRLQGRLVLWATAVALAAAAGALITAGWPFELLGILGFNLGLVAVAAGPVILIRRPTAYRWAAGLGALVLSGWAVVGVLGGFLLYVPAAIVLLGSAVVSPSWRPGVGAVIVGEAVLLAALAAVILPQLIPRGPLPDSRTFAAGQVEEVRWEYAAFRGPDGVICIVLSGPGTTEHCDDRVDGQPKSPDPRAT